MRAVGKTSLRVVMHAHSTWSYDGQWELDAIARLYGRLGVDAVMMTEHDTGFAPERFADYRAACAKASTARCQLIPGIEYSSPDNAVHILTWGLDQFLAEHQPVPQTLHAVQVAGGVAVFAHPIRKQAHALFDPAWAPYLSGIELWNRKSDGIVWGQEALEMIRQTGLPATVGQDFHRLKQLYPLTMQMTLDAPVQTPEALEQALVASVRTGQMQPQAFRRPLDSTSDIPGFALHMRLEAVRVILRDLLRGKRTS